VIVMGYKNILFFAFGLLWLLLAVLYYLKYARSTMAQFPYLEVLAPVVLGLAFIVKAFWQRPRKTEPPKN